MSALNLGLTEREPDVTVDLIGRASDGKTVLESSLVEYLIGMGGDELRDQIKLVAINGSLGRAVDDMKAEEWPEKSDPNRPAEQVKLRHRELLVAINSHPGEILRLGGEIKPETVRRLFGNNIVGVVVNAFRYDKKVAGKALPGLISYLQRPELGYPLVKAATIAYDLLFGINEEALKQQSHDYKDLVGHKDCVIAWMASGVGADGKFTLTSTKGDAVNEKALFRALRNLADFAACQDLDLLNLRQFIRVCPGVMVVLTRLDLLPVIPSLTEDDFTSVFDDAFGPTDDFWASQRIMARPVRLTYLPYEEESKAGPASKNEPTVKKPTQPSANGDGKRAAADRPYRVRLDTDGGRQLWNGIARAIQRRRASRLANRRAILTRFAVISVAFLLTSLLWRVLAWHWFALVWAGATFVALSLHDGGLQLPRSRSKKGRMVKPETTLAQPASNTKGDSSVVTNRIADKLAQTQSTK